MMAKFCEFLADSIRTNAKICELLTQSMRKLEDLQRRLELPVAEVAQPADANFGYDVCGRNWEEVCSLAYKRQQAPPEEAEDEID